MLVQNTYNDKCTTHHYDNIAQKQKQIINVIELKTITPRS